MFAICQQQVRERRLRSLYQGCRGVDYQGDQETSSGENKDMTSRNLLLMNHLSIRTFPPTSSNNVCRFSAKQSWERQSLVIRSWWSCVSSKQIWKLSSSQTQPVTTTSSSASCNAPAKPCHTFRLRLKQRRSLSSLATSSSRCQLGIWLEQLTTSHRLSFDYSRSSLNCAHTAGRSRSPRKESKLSSTCCSSTCRHLQLTSISPKAHRSCSLTSNVCFTQSMLSANNVPSIWHSLMIPQS